MSSIVLVVTKGFWGYTRRYSSVSIRLCWLYATLPIACFPIAHWYVLRGLWLWWGYGIRPAHTPRMVKGSISRCVCAGVRSASAMAIRELFSSLTSRYSIRPLSSRSSNSMPPFPRPFAAASMCSLCTSDRPSLQMISGRQTRPPSDAM